MNNLSIEDLEEIFLRVGQASYEELNKLRLVCQAWNKTIKMKLRGKNPSTEWGRIIASRVKRRLANGDPLSVAVIARAASLAHQGHLGSLDWMNLQDVDLSSVPADHLASLVSSVTGEIKIENVRGLVTFLECLMNRQLLITRQNLDSEETRALVRAMESRVEEVELRDEVTLDIRALMEYSGQGKCGKVKCHAGRYSYQLSTWATNRNWSMNDEDRRYLFIRRI